MEQIQTSIPAANSPFDLTINPKAYHWTWRAMRFLRQRLKVHIRLHHEQGQIEDGNIFLFNHFARFETFIPQYLFYEHCGALCRSVASNEFFTAGDPFSNYLLAIGAVPNNLPNLLAFMAAEALHGRKIIVFPEGGMIKDRQVLDGSGQYSVYSRSAERRRKQHSGAAVIALAMEVFKRAVRYAEAQGEGGRLENWAQTLQFSDPAALIAVAHKPTLIIPANITFYPMRVRGNALQRGVELFSGEISARMREELLIEGNILFKETDMDIRLGDPIAVTQFWTEREQRAADARAHRLGAFDDVFTLAPGRADKRLRANANRLQVERMRDTYMHMMYGLVNVHLSHLIALIIYELLDAGRGEVTSADLHRMLYLAVKYLQDQPGVYLHRSLMYPERYGGLLQGQCTALEQFLRTTTYAGLIEHNAERYTFLPKLLEEHGFDEIRLENPVEVYANEVAPIAPALEAVKSAISDAAILSEQRLAELLFDDQRRALMLDREAYSKPEHKAINRLQTQVEDPGPFFFQPEPVAADEIKPLGVLLVHGFLASPAEVRPFGEHLSRLGYPVVGIRLKGHGTSPWDLRARSRQDWLQSVRQGYDILAPFVEKICVVGFSTGGALGLQLAAEQPPKLAGVAPIATPMRFMNKNMVIVPLVHGANQLVQLVKAEGMMPFRPNESEHPHINYSHMPVRALYELGRLVEDLKKCLPQVQQPVFIVQGDQDPVVDPDSARRLYHALGSDHKKILMVPSERHGILYQSIGPTWSGIIGFINELVPATR